MAADIPPHPYFENAIRTRNWAKASNYVRLYCLKETGGLYFDTDALVIRSFDALLKEKCFFGMQDDATVGAGVIGAEPNHPLITESFQYLTEHFDGTEQVASSVEAVNEVLKSHGFSGGKAFKQVIGGVTIFPREYFYPYSWLERADRRKITINTHSVHFWQMSWCSWRVRIKTVMSRYPILNKLLVVLLRFKQKIDKWV